MFGVAFPYNRFPIVVAVWLVVGLVIVLASPRLAARIRVSLARDEGLEPPPAQRTRQHAARRAPAAINVRYGQVR